MLAREPPNSPNAAISVPGTAPRTAPCGALIRLSRYLARACASRLSFIGSISLTGLYKYTTAEPEYFTPFPASRNSHLFFTLPSQFRTAMPAKFRSRGFNTASFGIRKPLSRARLVSAGKRGYEPSSRPFSAESSIAAVRLHIELAWETTRMALRAPGEM